MVFTGMRSPFRFACRASGDQRMTPRQWFRLEAIQNRAAIKPGFDAIGNGQRFRQTAGPEFATGHGAFVRVHDLNTIGAQGFDISLCRRVLPHADIHRRYHQHRLVGGEQRG